MATKKKPKATKAELASLAAAINENLNQRQYPRPKKASKKKSAQPKKKRGA